MPIRIHQKNRTREAILQAASDVMKEGKTPTIALVSEKALVSRATTYRYFPSEEALLAETPLRDLTASANEFIPDDDQHSVEERVLMVQRCLTKVAETNPIQLRNLVRAHLLNASNATSDGNRAIRGPRRISYIERALEPVENSLSEPEYDRLFYSLCVLIGSESWIVLKDVCELNLDSMNDVLGWAIPVLVREALQNKSGATRVDSKPIRRKKAPGSRVAKGDI